MRKSNWHSLMKGVLSGILLISCFAAVAFAADLPDKERGYLGVSVKRITAEQKKELGISHGIKVASVMEKSPAEEAGIEEGDIILFFDGKKIMLTDDLTKAVRAVAPDTKVNVTVLRNGGRKDMTVKVGTYETGSVLFGKNGTWSWVMGGSEGYLGVELYTMNKDLAGYFSAKENEGALVLDVVKDGAAEKAGIHSGDVILQIAGEDVSGPDHARTIIKEYKKGDKVDVLILRKGQKMNFTVELGTYGGTGLFNVYKSGDKGDLQFFSVPSPEISDTLKNMILEIHEGNKLKDIKEELKELKEDKNGIYISKAIHPVII